MDILETMVWFEELENYWLRISNDTKATLKLVQRDFKRRHLSFNDNFKDIFLQQTRSRIAYIYEDFVDNSLHEKQFVGFHFTNNDIGSRTQNDRSNTKEDDYGGAESRVPTTHQPDLLWIAIQTSILDQTNIPTSQVEALNPQGNNIDKNINGQPSQSDENAVNASEFEQLTTSNSETGKDAITVAIDDHEETFHDLKAINSSGFCGSSESFRCLESFVAKCIDSNDITASIEEMLGDGSLLADQTFDDRMIEAVASPIERESDVFNTSAHEPPTNNQEVTKHNYADLNIEDQVISANVNGKSTEQEHSNEQGVQLDMPMPADDTHLADKSSENEQKLVRKRSCLPQKSGQQKKRKILEKAITGNLNKKRKLAIDSNETKQFKCELCVYATSYKCNLNQHIVKHSDEKPFKCEICAKGLSRKEYLNNHMRTHANQYAFQCSICRQGFSLEQKLKLHEKNCKQKCYECYLCKYICFQKKDLVKHMRIHSGEKPFKCTVCARGFTRNAHLKGHMRTHANQFPFHCSICRQGYSQKREKKSHEKNCNPKRFECYLCKYVSLYKSSLVIHMLKHTGTKPFGCSQCPKCFSHKWNLKVHMNGYHKK